MADGDAPGAVLRRLVAEAIDAEESDAGAIAADLVERGDDPGPAARLPALVGSEESIIGVVPRADTVLARRLLESGAEGDGDSGDAEGADDSGDVEGADDRTVRLVLTGTAADRITGPTGGVIRSILAERGVDAYRHDGDSPIGVLLVDDRAVVGLFDDRGLAALLWSDAPPVREWAAETCRRYLSAADPV